MRCTQRHHHAASGCVQACRRAYVCARVRIHVLRCGCTPVHQDTQTVVKTGKAHAHARANDADTGVPYKSDVTENARSELRRAFSSGGRLAARAVRETDEKGCSATSAAVTLASRDATSASKAGGRRPDSTSIARTRAASNAWRVCTHGCRTKGWGGSAGGRQIFTLYARSGVGRPTALKFKTQRASRL